MSAGLKSAKRRKRNKCRHVYLVVKYRVRSHEDKRQIWPVQSITQYSIQRRDCTVKSTTAFGEAPPVVPVGRPVVAVSLRLDPLLDEGHQVGPTLPRLLLAHVLEIDYVAVLGVGRAVVDLLAADVGEDALGVARVLLDQPVHLGERRRALRNVLVVEGEAHAEHDAALKALVGVGREPFGVGVGAGVEEEGGDPVDRAAVQLEGAGQRPLVDVHHRDDDGGLARPFRAAERAVDRAAGFADRTQAGGAGVALADRVGRDQPEGAAAAQQVERAAEEVGRRGRRCRAHPREAP